MSDEQTRAMPLADHDQPRDNPDGDEGQSPPRTDDTDKRAWLLLGGLGCVALVAVCVFVGGIAFLIAGSDNDDAVAATPTPVIADAPTEVPTEIPEQEPSPTPEETSTPEPTPEAIDTPEAVPTEEPTPTSTVAREPEPDSDADGPDTAFGDGTYIVGVEIEPGLYFANNAEEFCYWERLSGFGGDLDDIITNQIADYRAIVEIEESDTGFSAQRCGDWSQDPGNVRDGPVDPFEAGTYLVGEEIEPGTWRSNGADDACYWARLAGFTSELDDIITNSFGGVDEIVEIRAEDRGFESSECGIWERIED